MKIQRGQYQDQYIINVDTVEEKRLLDHVVDASEAGITILNPNGFHNGSHTGSFNFICQKDCKSKIKKG